MEHNVSSYHVPPPVSQLFKYTVDDNFNIEEGLCKPHNENVFLISSIAFLQKQLERKLGKDSDPDEKENFVNRKYSDLLLVESGMKSNREKYFIRLPNIEKFDEVLRNEASLPQKTLSNTQILPLPKAKSRRLVISNLFKTKAISNIIQNPVPKASHSLFNIFKKTATTNYCQDTANKVSSSDTSSTDSEMDFSQDKFEIISKNERKFILPSSCTQSSISILHTSAASTAISKYKCSDISIPTVNTSSSRHDIDSDSASASANSHTLPSISTHHRVLSRAEREILRVIPSETSLALKKSINQKLRVSKRFRRPDSTISQATIDFIIKDDYYEDPETGIKFKYVPKTVSNVKPIKLKEQQSKLSVCIEEETESEMDVYSSNHAYPFNCTDDVKTMVPSETLDVIMRQLLHNFDPNCL